jgi:hypothetical protein
MAISSSESSEEPKNKKTVLKKYCGVKPVPKGYELADPEYCIKTNQVRYYGLVQIDPKLLKQVESGAQLPKEREKLRIMEIKLKGLDKKRQDTIKIAKIHHNIKKDPKATEKEKKTAEKEYNKLKIEFDKIIASIEKLQKQVEVQRAHVHTMVNHRDQKIEKTKVEPKKAEPKVEPKKESKSKTKIESKVEPKKDKVKSKK